MGNFEQANAKTVLLQATRLPFKEGVSVLNDKLERLLGKIDNFQSHLFPQPDTGTADIPSSSDFADMLDRAHGLVERCENRLDMIRDRF